MPHLSLVHRQSCRDVSTRLSQVRSRGVHAGLVVEIGDPLSIRNLHLDFVDRFLVMGTEIGVKERVFTPALRRELAQF